MCTNQYNYFLQCTITKIKKLTIWDSCSRLCTGQIIYSWTNLIRNVLKPLNVDLTVNVGIVTNENCFYIVNLLWHSSSLHFCPRNKKLRYWIDLSEIFLSCYRQYWQGTRCVHDWFQTDNAANGRKIQLTASVLDKGSCIDFLRQKVWENRFRSLTLCIISCPPSVSLVWWLVLQF